MTTSLNDSGCGAEAMIGKFGGPTFVAELISE